jgi:hypothetical protein
MCGAYCTPQYQCKGNTKFRASQENNQKKGWRKSHLAHVQQKIYDK